MMGLKNFDDYYLFIQDPSKKCEHWCLLKSHEEFIEKIFIEKKISKKGEIYLKIIKKNSKFSGSKTS